MREVGDRIESALRAGCLVEHWRPGRGGQGRTQAHVHASWQLTVAVGGDTRLGLARGESVRPTRHVCILPPGVAHWIADDRDRPPGVQWFALYVPDSILQAAAQRAWGRSARPLFDSLVHEDRRTCDALAGLNAALLADRDDDAAAEHLLSTLSRLLHRHARPAPRGAWHARRIALLEAAARPAALQDEMELPPALPISRSGQYRAWQALDLPPRGLLRRGGQVDFAKRLLATGTSAAQAALEAGFHDQPHLTRRMRGDAMCTPGRYGRG